MTVVSRWVFDSPFASSPQSGLAWSCFLIEPGLADFPHPTLGRDSRFRPRKTRGTVWQLGHTVRRMKSRFRETLATRPRYVLFVAAPAAPSGGRAYRQK